MNEFDWHLVEDKPPLHSIEIAGVEVRAGDLVRLCPRSGGDVFDIALAGKIAAVESIEQDYEGEIHLSVVVDDDPGRDIGMMRQPGHRFFFKTSEVEPLGQRPASERMSVRNCQAILIAGIGNIFLGDDAFGVEVASRLSARNLPESVRVVDFGIRGLDLAYALIDGPDVTILVDACPRGGAPGDLYVIEPDLEASGETPAGMALDAHSMNPMNVIRAAHSMGGPLKRIILVGCEPQTLGPDEGHMGLSETVSSAVDRAIVLLESLVGRILAGEALGHTSPNAEAGAAT